jgi:hypothetical protein
VLDQCRDGLRRQQATLRGNGAPIVCNLWYASAFRPDRLYFISRPAREHCVNIAGETHHRVYQIEVTEWVLYDEEHFRGQPRQSVEAQC